MLNFATKTPGHTPLAHSSLCFTSGHRGKICRLWTAGFHLYSFISTLRITLFEAVLGKALTIFTSNILNKQLKRAYEWLSDNSDWALDVFYELNPGQTRIIDFKKLFDS